MEVINANLSQPNLLHTCVCMYVWRVCDRKLGRSMNKKKHVCCWKKASDKRWRLDTNFIHVDVSKYKCYRKFIDIFKYIDCVRDLRNETLFISSYSSFIWQNYSGAIKFNDILILVIFLSIPYFQLNNFKIHTTKSVFPRLL